MSTHNSHDDSTSHLVNILPLRVAVYGYFAVTWASANPREAYMEMGATVTLDFEL
jgi:hypothetical protein